MPERGLRGKARSRKAPKSALRSRSKQSLMDFTRGKQSLINSFKLQVDIFKSTNAPYFPDVTEKVLQKEQSWNYILGFIPFQPASRMIDILPGLFIVGGIFGTFLGITSALPLIAQIDLNQMDQAGPLLAQFVFP